MSNLNPRRPIALALLCAAALTPAATGAASGGSSGSGNGNYRGRTRQAEALLTRDLPAARAAARRAYRDEAAGKGTPSARDGRFTRLFSPVDGGMVMIVRPLPGGGSNRYLFDRNNRAQRVALGLWGTTVSSGSRTVVERTYSGPEMAWYETKVVRADPEAKVTVRYAPGQAPQVSRSPAK